MRRLICIVLGVTAGFAGDLFKDLQGADAKPKAIKQIMKAQKGPIDKVRKGNATAADKKKLLELYTDLGKNKPPVGDADNWKTLTENLVSASQDLVDGKDGAKGEFLKAVDCNTCHQAHRRK
jgi:hypothetical protein